MRILAVDTTTSNGSVALALEGRVVGEVRLGRQEAHSRTLLPSIEFLLDGLGLRPAEVNGYAVAVGPGSFTGLRVGISTVQGLALASGHPCLGVSALDALAARIEGAAEKLVALMDAYRDEVYARIYDARALPLGPPVAEKAEAFLAGLPRNAALVGDGVARYRPVIERLCPGALRPERSLFLAGTIARLAAPRLAAGEGVDPEALRPLYLRGVDIRTPRA